MMRLSVVILMACLCIASSIRAQKEADFYDKVRFAPGRFLNNINNKTQRLEDNIINKSESSLKKLSKEEKRLYKKLYKKDSAVARQLFENRIANYQSLETYLKAPVDQIKKRGSYFPLLDTLTTSIHFLEKNNAIQDSKLVQQTLGQVQSMQSRFDQAAQIQQYLHDRQQYLKEQLAKLNMVSELRNYSRKLFYYNAQLNEYKSILKDPGKLERKVIDLLSKTKPFQDFMNKYSILGSLFPSQSNLSSPTDGGTGVALPDLQTNAQINSLMQQTLAGPNNSLQSLQSNIQQAQSQLQQLKNKINEAGGNGNEGELPDFKPNNQKIKPFWNRLEIGTTLQSVRSNVWMPSTTQIGFSVGYKLDDRSVVGVGMASSIGWSGNIKHIAMSYEGVGVRSYVDWKLKGSFWISAGYEMNYQQVFTQIAQLHSLNAWQQSDLIGISKKYQVSKKFKGKMSLLWDFLSYSQVPRTQPILFRLGYSLK